MTTRERAWFCLLALLASCAAPATAQDRRLSGNQFISADTRALELDDTQNPAMLWVLEGEALWQQKSAAGPACAQCHATPATLATVPTRYPVFHEASGTVIDVEDRINLCRVQKQNEKPFAGESKELLALTALLGREARGRAVALDKDTRLTPALERGKALFSLRQGQLNLSCAICHDDNAGKSLGGALIPQGHPNAYPIYRLEWQSVGSLQRRLRNCLVGMRAEPFAAGSAEYTALQLYLMSRAEGMPLEAPGVRP